MERKFIVCDPSKCVDCGLCELACSATKEGVYNPLFSRIHMARIEPEISMSIACCLCQEPQCVEACPKNALTQNEETGLIQVHNYGYKCDGCGWCMHTCKWGAIALDPKEGVAMVCDLCEPNEPECVKACPKNALSLATVEEVTRETEKEETATLIKEVFKDSGNV